MGAPAPAPEALLAERYPLLARLRAGPPARLGRISVSTYYLAFPGVVWPVLCGTRLASPLKR